MDCHPSNKIRIKGYYFIRKNEIKVITDSDFCRYYKFLFDKAHYYTLKTQTPMHGAHIGIINPKIHKGVNCLPFFYLKNKPVWFEVDIRGNYGGFKKGFLNFWLDVFNNEFIVIRKKLGVYKEEGEFNPFHITILNTKNDKKRIR